MGGVQSSQSFYRGACIPVKSRLKASGWNLRVLGRYESSLICANLKVGRERYKAQRYNRLWVELVVPTVQFAHQARPR